jgi:ferredoxin-thioredoxin reductase catalytic subunit
MPIKLNENAQIVKMLKDKMKENGGYCPCRLTKSEDTKCICKEFREQIADESFEGYCHCMLYYKSK